MLSLSLALCLLMSVFGGSAVFVTAETTAYLGCTQVGIKHWNILTDYIWAPFVPDKELVSSVDAYVDIRAGVGTLTIGIYTDYFGKGEFLGEATMECSYDAEEVGWQTLTFDTPVAEGSFCNVKIDTAKQYALSGIIIK